MIDLNKKIIVVTGGAGLIGRSFVESVIQHNGIAVIADMNQEEGIKLCNQLNEKTEKNEPARFVKLDITDKKSIEKLLQELSHEYKQIDALINNAYPRNKNYGRQFFDVEYADFCENTNLHIGGYFLASQQFGDYFRKQGWGNIINMASIYGVMPPRFEIYDNTSMSMPVEYAAIKASILHLTRYMAKYFKGMNIRVNAISPGGIIDGQAESFLKAYNSHCSTKGMLEPGDLQGTLLYLLSDLSQFVTGQNLIIDDGFSL